MTTTAMKRAGQLVAHLGILHQISDVRQLLLLQLAMRERQDQVALFRRQEDAVTLSLIGTQMSAPTAELSHRAGSAPAAALLTQLQDISGIRGDDVAFSSGQLSEMIAAQTQKIERSEGLAKLDAALLSMIGRLEQEQPLPSSADDQGLQATEAQPQAALSQEAPTSEAQPAALEADAHPGESVADAPDAPDEDQPAEAGFSTVRVSRRRSA